MTQQTANQENTDWEGDLQLLASKVRRRPVIARELRLFYLVRFLAKRWRIVRDLQLVSEEAPVTAWIIRRKSDLVLPQKDPEPESEVPTAESRREDVFVRQATEALQGLWAMAQDTYARPVTEHPASRYRPVKGADPEKLAAAWPKLRVKSAAVPQRVVKAESNPLDERISRVLHRLHDYGRPLTFDMTVEHKNPADIGNTFLAVVHLWHQEAVELNQEKPYDAIWIALKAPLMGDDG